MLSFNNISAIRTLFTLSKSGCDTSRSLIRKNCCVFVRCTKVSLAHVTDVILRIFILMSLMRNYLVGNSAYFKAAIDTSNDFHVRTVIDTVRINHVFTGRLCVGMITSLYYEALSVSVNDMPIRKMITNVGREITAGNYRNTAFLSKYVAGRIFGGGISYGKCTAADINSTVEGIYVTVNRLKGTALDSGSSPVTDQIVILRCGKATVFNGKRTCSSNADAVNIFEIKASARDSKVSANYHCVLVVIDILYVNSFTVKLPLHVAFNNDLLDNCESLSVL